MIAIRLDHERIGWDGPDRSRIDLGAVEPPVRGGSRSSTHKAARRLLSHRTRCQVLAARLFSFSWHNAGARAAL